MLIKWLIQLIIAFNTKYFYQHLSSPNTQVAWYEGEVWKFQGFYSL